MFREGDSDIKEDLLEARDRELGLDQRGGCSDLGDGLQDRNSRGNNRATGNGRIPVSSVLDLIS